MTLHRLAHGRIKGTDADGIRRDHLLDRLKDLKAKALSKGGERVNRDDVTIADDAERDRLVAELYDDTKRPDKPRNAIGIAKTLPTAEMERLLLADIKLDPTDPRWLSDARADVVCHFRGHRQDRRRPRVPRHAEAECGRHHRSGSGESG